MLHRQQCLWWGPHTGFSCLLSKTCRDNWIISSAVHAVSRPSQRKDIWKLTGLGPGEGGGFSAGGAVPSADSSSCLLMSRVVKRFDSSPKMWIIANLFAGLGWNKNKKKKTFENHQWWTEKFLYKHRFTSELIKQTDIQASLELLMAEDVWELRLCISRRLYYRSIFLPIWQTEGSLHWRNSAEEIDC